MTQNLMKYGIMWRMAMLSPAVLSITMGVLIATYSHNCNLWWLVDDSVPIMLQTCAHIIKVNVPPGHLFGLSVLCCDLQSVNLVYYC
jgi:hypothetical protein